MNTLYASADVQSFVLARLSNFNLGNPGGIPSSLADATDNELADYAARFFAAVVPVDDVVHYRCIDGRRCLHNGDGTTPAVRLGHLGGTLTLPAVAMTGDAPLVSTIDTTQDGCEDRIMTAIETKLQLERSAHTGGCGGANGLIDDYQAMHGNPAVVTVAGAIMNHEALATFTKIPYFETVGGEVRRNAGKTVDWLNRRGWQGAAQVHRAEEISPAGVEVLDADKAKPFNGHEEPAIVMVYSRSGMNTLSTDSIGSLGMGRPFIASLNASEHIARQLAAAGDDGSISRLMTADVANCVAAGSRLASPETPVFLTIIP